MEEVLKATTGYQLIVRKRISSIVEKLLRCCGNDFRHDIYKQIVYDYSRFFEPVFCLK